MASCVCDDLLALCVIIDREVSLNITSLRHLQQLDTPRNRIRTNNTRHLMFRRDAARRRLPANPSLRRLSGWNSGGERAARILCDISAGNKWGP